MKKRSINARDPVPESAVNRVKQGGGEGEGLRGRGDRRGGRRKLALHSKDWP